jgi:hypothetical protein
MLASVVCAYCHSTSFLALDRKRERKFHHFLSYYFLCMSVKVVVCFVTRTTFFDIL